MKETLISFITILLLTACNQPSSKTETTKGADTTTQGATFKPANIQEQMIYNRAIEAVIWGMPAVNFELFIEELAKAKGDFNQVVYWGGLSSSKNQTLTPNPDVIYVNPFYDTRQGPVVTRDMAMIDQLKSIGIEKEKTFQPDTRMIDMLNTAIIDAHMWLDKKYEEVFIPPFYEGTHWARPSNIETVKAISQNYLVPDVYPVDGRAVSYSMAYFSPKHLGVGQTYLMTIKDNHDKPFDGSGLYHLYLPPNVPVKLYWSVTAYDRETHALIPGMKHSSSASTTPGLQKNPDGSVDIYFGAKAPEGKEPNWIPTNPQREFELLVRFYGPEKALLDKTWKMGDVEEEK